MTTPITQAYQYIIAISIILVAIPFRWHLRAQNTGTCLYMTWIGIGCVIQFVNSIVWAEDAIIRYPIWCDICTHFQVALNTALPACSLIISRRLYRIANGRASPDTTDGRRKEVIVDLCIGLGLPLLSAALYIIPQGHRFNIYQEIGCWNASYPTIAALLLINVWPLSIAIISGAYTCLIAYTLVRRNFKIKEITGSDSNITFSGYWRLIILSSMDIVFTIPLYTFSLYITSLNLQPWISWDNVHADFGRIDQFPSITWRGFAVLVVSLEFTRWSFVLCAFVVFALFGFGAEAMRNYRSTWTSVLSHIALFATSVRNILSLTPLKAIHSRPGPGQSSVLPIFIRLDHTQDLHTSNFASSSASSNTQNFNSHLKTSLGRLGKQTNTSKVVPIVHV